MDRIGAIELARRALQQGDTQPLILMLVAEDLEQRGRDDDAITLLRQAVAVEKDEPELWRRLAVILGRKRLFDQSAAAFEEALDFDPDDPALLRAAASAYFQAGDFPAAQLYYERLVELVPDDAAPPGALAAIAVRRHDPATARAWAQRSLALSATDIGAQLALVRADILDKDHAAALQRIEELITLRSPSDDLTVTLLDLRAEAHDGLDRIDEAFADYARRNAMLRRLYAPHIERQAGGRPADHAQNLAKRLGSTDAMPGRRIAHDTAMPPDVAGHVFLIGFPRSGTTLLEKALAGHPGILSLPEIDCLSDMGMRVLEGETGLHALRSLSPDHARQFSDRYWTAVRTGIGEDIAGRIVVDKMPLHAALLPLIATIFPRAKILLALRDPRDVILSCFRRRFLLNAAMYELLSLERATLFYDGVMQIVSESRRLWPLALMEVRHEAVVADLETELRHILEFIGVAWDEGVLGFAARARARPRTPSDLQLLGGLSTQGLQQWRRYEDHLAPVLPSLARWVARYGYDPITDRSVTHGS